jgi:hypothetical protein
LSIRLLNTWPRRMSWPRTWKVSLPGRCPRLSSREFDRRLAFPANLVLDRDDRFDAAARCPPERHRRGQARHRGAGIGDVRDQPVEAADVVLDDREALAIVGALGERQGFDGERSEVSGFFSSWATSAAKRSMASMRDCRAPASSRGTQPERWPISSSRSGRSGISRATCRRGGHARRHRPGLRIGPAMVPASSTDSTIITAAATTRCARWPALGCDDLCRCRRLPSTGAARQRPPEALDRHGDRDDRVSPRALTRTKWPARRTRAGLTSGRICRWHRRILLIERHVAGAEPG